MRVHFIQQDHWVLPGEYLAWAERSGYEIGPVMARLTPAGRKDPFFAAFPDTIVGAYLTERRMTTA